MFAHNITPNTSEKVMKNAEKMEISVEIFFFMSVPHNVMIEQFFKARKRRKKISKVMLALRSFHHLIYAACSFLRNAWKIIFIPSLKNFEVFSDSLAFP